MSSTLQLSMWLRDILEDLCHQKIRDITDFEWQKYIRPYLLPSEDEPMDQEDLEATDTNKDSSGVESKALSPSSCSIVLRCLDQQLSYGFEYQGCASLPVMTARMDNYIIAFTQVCVIFDLVTSYVYYCQNLQ